METVDNIKELEQELGKLLVKFDVPEKRKNDYGWMLRNIGIANKDNPNFDRVVFIIKTLAKLQMNNK